MLNTHPKTGEPILWSWTIFYWTKFMSLSFVRMAVLGISFLTFVTLVILTLLFLEDSYRFSQPRDALAWSPGYVQVKEDAETYCASKCSQEQLDLFLVARDATLKREWSKVLEVTLQDRRWRQHAFVDFSMGWRIRDDYRNLISRVGGSEVAASCHPIVEWTVTGAGMRDSFAGLRCDGTEYLLTY